MVVVSVKPCGKNSNSICCPDGDDWFEFFRFHNNGIAPPDAPGRSRFANWNRASCGVPPTWWFPRNLMTIWTMGKKFKVHRVEKPCCAVIGRWWDSMAPIDRFEPSFCEILMKEALLPSFLRASLSIFSVGLLKLVINLSTILLRSTQCCHTFGNFQHSSSYGRIHSSRPAIEKVI